MVEIIAIVVTLISSVVVGAIKAQNARYAQAQAQDQAKVDYERNKTLSVYNLLGLQTKEQATVATVLIIAVIVFIVLLFVVKSKK